MWFDDIQAADSYAITCRIKEYKNFNILKVVTRLLFSPFFFCNMSYATPHNVYNDANNILHLKN